VLQLSLGVADPGPRLRDIGLKVDASGISYHVSRFPMVLLMPRESFERKLRIEGCEVQQAAPFEDPNSSSLDSQGRWWNFFPFPPTADGARLGQIARAVISCCVQHIPDTTTIIQNYGLPVRPPEPAIGPLEQFLLFEAPGPKQSMLAPYRPALHRPFQAPAADRIMT
jgi:hypothetical protein